MKNLVIVESPAKAKTIEKYLGKDYTVKASVGHVRDLPKSNKKAIDIDGGFVPNYVINKDKQEVVDELCKLSKKSDNVIIATDPDREGEAIAWHIKEVCDLKDPKRIVFHEITEGAVQEAIEHPRDIDDRLTKAQEARRVLDRLFGYDLSELIWRKVRYGLSAGRVQSPALRILMERERDIQSFDPVTYWTITACLRAGTHRQADLTAGKGAVATYTCTEEPTEKDRVDEIVKAGENGSWTVTDIEESEQKRNPRAPFVTSTLQQTASTRLGFTPSRTMMLAQRLYEAGHITYMRTDSTNLSSDAQKQALAVINEKFGNEYAEGRTYKTKSKAAQEAHEAIRPTNMNKMEAGADASQKKLYKLIWQRTVASQMSPAKLKKTKVTANISESQIPDFTVNGSRLLFDGWLAADPESRSDDVELPQLQKGDTLTLSSIDAEEKQTQPPSRYTEAGLVKELEKRGIGRPSTYATIIKNIQDRGYVIKEGKTLMPTDTGEVVSTFLENHFQSYISDDFTAEMENELDEIAEGDREYEKTLREFYEQFRQEIDAKADIEKLTTLGDADPQYTCPKCGASMVIKLGRDGKFLSCSKFPDCDGARTYEGKEIADPVETGEDCPECGNPLVEREGKYGKFISCSNYPKCKYIKKDKEQERANSTGVECPDCGKGFITEKRGKYGPFYGCSEYPNCRFTMKSKPTGNKCPECGKLMMEGTKTIPERCSDKNCPYHNPHKMEK